MSAMLGFFLLFLVFTVGFAWFVTRGIPKIKEAKRKRTLIGKLHDNLSEAESRISRADTELENLTWDDPNYGRWFELRARAKQEKRGIELAIEEYHIQQEEERMLNGSSE